MAYMYNYSVNNGFPNSWNSSGDVVRRVRQRVRLVNYRGGGGVERYAEGGRGYTLQYSQNKKEYYVYNNHSI